MDDKLSLPAGNLVWRLADHYAAKMNQTEFATTLRQGQLIKERYLAYISAMYPIVIGFNRGLIHSLAKVDHVRECALLKALARQLQEEQLHNQLWRKKLEVYGIDHDRLYATLEDYLARFSPNELGWLTGQTIEQIYHDEKNVTPGCFPESVFPEPVIALYHYLWLTGSGRRIDFWAHFACQSAIEAVEYNVVSTSIFPGVAGNELLDIHPASIAWWRKHARQGNPEGGTNIEEEHLEIAKFTLNRSKRANMMKQQIISRVENTLVLFAATMRWHDYHENVFPLDNYLRQQPYPSNSRVT
jgi:hypothetical protein